MRVYGLGRAIEEVVVVVVEMVECKMLCPLESKET